MRTLTVFLPAVIALACAPSGAGLAAEGNAQKLDRDARSALETLYDKVPAANALGDRTTAILVFPPHGRE